MAKGADWTGTVRDWTGTVGDWTGKVTGCLEQSEELIVTDDYEMYDLFV